MNYALRLKVGLVCSFWGVKCPEMYCLAFAGLDTSGPHRLSSPGSFLYAKQLRDVIASCVALVLQIPFARHIAKVDPAVVCGVAVDVVNMVFRPFAGDIKPNKTVNQILVAKNSSIEIAVWHSRASCFAEIAKTATAPTIRCLYGKPRKDASFGIVVKKLAQKLRGKIGLSHDALQLLIGQRPASVSALCGPRYFTRQSDLCDTCLHRETWPALYAEAVKALA